jgi:hypothetical protein
MPTNELCNLTPEKQRPKTISNRIYVQGSSAHEIAEKPSLRLWSKEALAIMASFNIPGQAWRMAGA